ncbi:NEDD4-binding protein 2-like 2 isoform X3 [Peromyscus leucopus]|uniref:NEDD4-binding protein 2-like 2 isoform X3 n=1 Tax=Peromyscus leucopus TaxID=10041 RepID=UPI0010A11C8E|nr:NEDD4-binding protein 2-like 2 isoform X3 [Peromyscus leucopus]
MPYSEIEAKFLGPGKELTREPCSKKLKSAADDCVLSHRGGPESNRLQEKTRNNRSPVATINFRRRICPEEDKTTAADVLKPSYKEMPGDKLGAAEAIGSKALQDGKPSSLSKDDEIYSTSKAFIGPIYKPPEKKKCREKKHETDSFNSVDDKRRREEKQKFISKKLEIDTELSQFYKEIEELENENDTSQGSCKVPEPSPEQIIPYDQAYGTLKSEEESEDLSSALQSHCGYQQYLENEPGRHPCDEQVMPPFCDTSFSSFGPEWQSIHPFVIPHGPPLPSFNYHFNIPRFDAPLNPPPNIFHGQDDSQMQNGCYVDSCQDSWNCLTFDQNDEYVHYGVTSSTVQPFRNGYSVQDESMSDGFCEIRECWREPLLGERSGADRLVSQWFPEEKLNKLQKLLILLRGLPGSGKTTLSRILLGQSRDGIVFSTDDYFHHQDGYRYNVNQLGDAHDWNQSRAKQAIDQGRSPVIIDNTNTQAWEMKPYVEMAIGKGYRVEFHEPETWWKFDPEELEKRNKHGVSRKKIAQMLDRYEFQMSISIVMNSVEPPQKSTQRPLPLPGEPRGRVLKKSGYRFDRPKQKRNRRGKKRNNSFRENSPAALGHLAPGGQGPSQSEGEGFEETNREPGHPFAGGLQNEAADCVDGSEEQSWRDRENSNSFQKVVSAVEVDHTPKNCFPEEEEEEEAEGLFLTLPSVPSEGSACWDTSTQHRPCVVKDGYSDRRSGSQVRSGRNSAGDTQDTVAKTPRRRQSGARMSEEMLREEHGVRSDRWAFFTVSLFDEELEIKSESQPYLGGWPQGPHEFVCEQRPRKDRSRRLTRPDSEEQCIKLISAPEEAAGSGSGPETPVKKQPRDLSPKAGVVDLPRNPETAVSSTCAPHLGSPEHPLEPTKGIHGVQRICDLSPNRQTPTNPETKEKCDLLTENHELNTVLSGEDISKIINKDETKPKMMVFDCRLPRFYFDSPPSIVRQSRSYRLPFNRVGCAVYFYKNPVPSLLLHYLSSFCVLSFNDRRALLTFESQKSLARTLTDGAFIPSDDLSGQPAAHCFLQIFSDTQFLNERPDEELKTWGAWEPGHCSAAEDCQELISRTRRSRGHYHRAACLPPSPTVWISRSSSRCIEGRAL